MQMNFTAMCGIVVSARWKYKCRRWSFVFHMLCDCWMWNYTRK